MRGGAILSHALRKAWTLSAILRSTIITRGSRLVADGWQSVRRRLARYTYGLSHLSIDRRFTRWTTLVRTLLLVGTVSLFVCLSLCLFLLLLGLPFLTDLLEFYRAIKSAIIYIYVYKAKGINGCCQDNAGQGHCS